MASKVAEILAQMAQNAGQTALRRGALLGGTIAQAADVPAQYFADQDRKRIEDLHTAQVQQQMQLQAAQGARESTTFGQQQDAYTKAQRKEAVHQAALSVGFANAGGDPAKFDLKAATDYATQHGEPDLAQSMATFHNTIQKPALPFITNAPGSVTVDPNKPIDPTTGQFPVVSRGTPPPPTTAGNEAAIRALYAKQASGATLTPDETNQIKGYETEKELGKVKPLDQQLLEAVAKGDTVKVAQIQKTFATEATAKRDPAAAAQLAAIRALTQQQAQARLDDMDTGSDKNQQKFEQQYRTVLQRGLSSRSGGLGLEDAKVQQANHLMSIFEQNYDPKTGEWNIPRVQLNELALGLARLTSPGGQAGEAMLKEFQQRTVKGDIAGALTYLTGQPIAANTQAITQMLKDSIERQGRTAETNREGEMAYLRGLAPTDLAEERRQQLEKTSLNPLRQSRVAVDDKGNKKLFVSVDGGVTWK